MDLRFPPVEVSTNCGLNFFLLLSGDAALPLPFRDDVVVSTGSGANLRGGLLISPCSAAWSLELITAVSKGSGTNFLGFLFVVSGVSGAALREDLVVVSTGSGWKRRGGAEGGMMPEAEMGG